MDQTKSKSRQIVEASVIEKIKGLNAATLATLEILLDRLEDLRNEGQAKLPADYKENPNRFTMGFFDAHSKIFVDMLNEYSTAKVHDGSSIFEGAMLLSITSMYLAENMIESVEFSEHPAVAGEKAEADSEILNP